MVRVWMTGSMFVLTDADTTLSSFSEKKRITGGMREGRGTRVEGG
jgi:hypothetical protein